MYFCPPPIIFAVVIAIWHYLCENGLDNPIKIMTELTKTDFRLAAIILLSASILTFTSCFPTEHYEPDFNIVSESASQIPSSGLLYDAEFNWEYVETKTSKPIAYRQFRFRLNLDSKTGETQIPNERVFPMVEEYAFVNGDWAFRENAYGSPAVLYVQIPANTSADSRKVSIEICIDSLYNYSYTEKEGQEHRWGEWFTVFEGTQAGRVYPDEMMPSHSLEKSQANIFEPVRINMHKCDEAGNLSWYRLNGICDSLIWSVKGLEGSRVVMNTNNETIYFGHRFTLPGEYESVLSAYKGNRVIYKDVKNITITDDKDFLMFDWEEVISGNAQGEAYLNALNPDVEFGSIVKCDDGNPQIFIYVVPSDRLTPEDERQILYNYMCELYYVPTGTGNGQAEWATDTSVARLVNTYNEFTETDEWRIIAEPLRD